MNAPIVSKNQFKMVILSPSKTLLEDEVVFAVVPGSEGELGILVNHAPLVTTLKAGNVKIYKDDQKTITQEIEIAGGFMDVKDNTCQLLINK